MKVHHPDLNSCAEAHVPKLSCESRESLTDALKVGQSAEFGGDSASEGVFDNLQFFRLSLLIQ